jgi:ribosomal protein S18 acetylase RimI-like enzyme
MRSAIKDDAAAIAALDMQLFPENCFNERTLAREVDAGAGLVIYEGGDLVGYILVRWDWEVMDITRIGVRLDRQSRGLGSKMLFSVISGTQLDTILCVDKSNRRALRLYQEHGFKIVSQLNKSWVMRRSTS